jgi:hypothetical protein
LTGDSDHENYDFDQVKYIARVQVRPISGISMFLLTFFFISSQHSFMLLVLTSYNMEYCRPTPGYLLDESGTMVGAV